MAQQNKGFCSGFQKVAAGTIMGMKPATAKKVYYGLEQGGLGALTALDLHDAYKAHKEGDKAGVKKGLLGAGALGTLMGATHLAKKIGH